MASYTVNAAVHKQLAANTVDTVTLDPLASAVEVINRDGTAEIYFTVDGANPTVGGDDTQVLLAGIGSLEIGSPAIGSTVVKLISAGTPKYSVRTITS